MTDTITVIGNIATEPQQRPIGNGASVTSFRVASTERKLDRTTGAWSDGHTSFYTVSAFRSLGAHAFTSLRKGERVIVVGRLRVKEWDNGTRQGTNAEIDADALGHDLQWGITRFEKAGGSVPAAVESAPQPTEPERELVGTDGWGVPGGSEGDGRAVDTTPF